MASISSRNFSWPAVFEGGVEGQFQGIELAHYSWICAEDAGKSNKSKQMVVKNGDLQWYNVKNHLKQVQVQ